MDTSGSSFPDRLRDALIQLTPDRPDSVDALLPLYADDVVFRDPIQETHGIDEFIAMNRRLLRRMRTVQWDVTTAKGDGDLVFLEWTMSGATKLGVKLKVEGMTRARTRDGRVFDHRDYWDLGELAASSIPGGKRILQTLLSPFA